MCISVYMNRLVVCAILVCVCSVLFTLALLWFWCLIAWLLLVVMALSVLNCGCLYLVGLFVVICLLDWWVCVFGCYCYLWMNCWYFVINGGLFVICDLGCLFELLHWLFNLLFSLVFDESWVSVRICDWCCELVWWLFCCLLLVFWFVSVVCFGCRNFGCYKVGFLLSCFVWFVLMHMLSGFGYFVISSDLLFEFCLSVLVILGLMFVCLYFDCWFWCLCLMCIGVLAICAFFEFG